MKAMVIGADGAIGSALIAALERRGNSVLATTRRPARVGERCQLLDLAGPDVGSVMLPRTDVAIFCAAITSLAECRKQPDVARQINVAAPLGLARRMAQDGTRVVLLSTCAVYDWRKPLVPANDPPRPLSVYGQLKAEAEAGFCLLGDAAAILRITKVLTPGASLFRGWIDALGHNAKVNAFSDMRMAPVDLDHTLEALLAVADDKGSGIYQVSAARDISYFDTARHFAERMGIDASYVVAAQARDNGIPPEEITIYSSLDSARLSAMTGRRPPDPLTILDKVYGDTLNAAKIKIRV